MVELTLSGLRVLREVAARGSFTAAAEAMGYTQSSISRQIAALEAAAGGRLFERETRGVRLTEAGRVLLRHGAKVLDQVEAADHELTALRELSTGTLTVGGFPTAMTALLPRALAAFGDRHPGVGIALREGTTPAQLRMLRAGTTDLAVVAPSADEPDDPGLTVDPLLRDPLLLAVSREHPLAATREVDVDDLATHQWIIGKDEAGDPQLDLWRRVAWQPRTRFVVKDWTAKLALVASGLGVALVPGLAAPWVRDDVALIAIRMPDRAPVARDVAMATRTGARELPHVRVIADLLHYTAAELAREVEARLQDRWM